MGVRQAALSFDDSTSMRQTRPSSRPAGIAGAKVAWPDGCIAGLRRILQGSAIAGIYLFAIRAATQVWKRLPLPMA